MVTINGHYMVNDGYHMTAWWCNNDLETYEKPSVGMIIPFPTEWKIIKNHVPNHQPE